VAWVGWLNGTSFLHRFGILSRIRVRPGWKLAERAQVTAFSVVEARHRFVVASLHHGRMILWNREM